MKFTRKFIYSVIVFTSFALGSCSSDDGGSSTPAGKTVRLTVSVSNSYDTDENHYLFVGFGAGAANGGAIDLKVNGTLKTNQLVVSANPMQFDTTKTYVFETAEDYDFVSINISRYCLSDDVSFTLSYKIEKGSEVIEDKTEEVTKIGGPADESFMIRFDD